MTAITRAYHPFPPLQPPKTNVLCHNFSPPFLFPTPPKLPAISSSLAQTSISSQNQPYLQPRPLSNLNSSDHGDDELLLHLLRIAGLRCDVRLGRSAHAAIAKSAKDIRLANAVIFMYAKLGLLTDAEAAFDHLTLPDACSYTSLVSAYARQGREADAVRLFFRMRDSGMEPDEFTFVALLTACTSCGDLQLGSQIHATVVKSGCVGLTYVLNVLLGFYETCGCAEDALQVFDEMPERDVVSWTTVISALLQDLQHGRAFELFRDMQVRGVRADNYTVSRLLAACTGNLHWRHGKELHAHALRIGLESDVNVNNALIGFYVKCGSISSAVTARKSDFLADAQGLFDRLTLPDVISYAILISAYANHGRETDAVHLFFQMLNSGIEPNRSAYIAVFTACIHCRDLQLGSQIHAAVVKSGYVAFTYISNVVMGLYVTCGCTEDAVRVFDEMLQRDVASWETSPDVTSYSTLISVHARDRRGAEAVRLFFQMRDSGVEPHEFAYIAVLTACIRCRNLHLGSQIHAAVVKSSHVASTYVSNAVMGFYAACGLTEEAVQVFDEMQLRDVGLWNTSHDVSSYATLISAYAKRGREADAVHLFCRMRHLGVEPEEFTYIAVLTACIRCRDLKLGSQIHAAAVKSSYVAFTYVSYALKVLYAKCQCSEDFGVVECCDFGSDARFAAQLGI